MLECRQLSVQRKRSPILNDVNFRVEKGQTVTIIGPNGSGKSTLLKCLTRIVSDFTGEIVIAGKSQDRYDQRALARVLGYVPQSMGGVIPFTVEEFVGLGRYPHMRPFQRMEGHHSLLARKAIELLQLQSFATRKLTSLSGGELQRVWIAATLVQQPQVLLLDEPLTFLDVAQQTKLNGLFGEVAQALGLTTLWVTHDLTQAVIASDRILALKKGRVLFFGPPEELMQAGVLKRIFDISFHVAMHPVAGVPVPFVDQDSL